MGTSWQVRPKPDRLDVWAAGRPAPLSRPRPGLRKKLQSNLGISRPGAGRRAAAKSAASEKSPKMPDDTDSEGRSRCHEWGLQSIQVLSLLGERRDGPQGELDSVTSSLEVPVTASLPPAVPARAGSRRPLPWSSPVHRCGCMMHALTHRFAQPLCPASRWRTP